jgi:hypothetical protein
MMIQNFFQEMSRQGPKNIMQKSQGDFRQEGRERALLTPKGPRVF